ncbi:hypothetical protein HK100_010227 [Physocladia obscura]|uniref:Uncharacterized protein n=1 Tax=Physocladia obscura TaxID=109957 RepID=A0AAD5T3U4_9FUNG|nr:hypothetical protein HK100_010227 [Physocladia obscura]
MAHGSRYSYSYTTDGSAERSYSYAGPIAVTVATPIASSATVWAAPTGTVQSQSLLGTETSTPTASAPESSLGSEVLGSGTAFVISTTAQSQTSSPAIGPIPETSAETQSQTQPAMPQQQNQLSAAAITAITIFCVVGAVGLALFTYRARQNRLQQNHSLPSTAKSLQPLNVATREISQIELDSVGPPTATSIAIASAVSATSDSQPEIKPIYVSPSINSVEKSAVPSVRRPSNTSSILAAALPSVFSSTRRVSNTSSFVTSASVAATNPSSIRQALNASSSNPRLSFPVNETGPCTLHPLATEKHTLGDCHTYRRYVSQKRFVELETLFKEAEITVRRAEASALVPKKKGAHAHILSDCHTYRRLVLQKRFAELERAFASAATIVEAVEPFSVSDDTLQFPYILNKEAACALHPTATGEKRHKLGECYTYRRLVAANKFEELEERLKTAGEKVNAVKKVTFSSSILPDSSIPSSSSADKPDSASAAAVDAGDNNISATTTATTSTPASEPSIFSTTKSSLFSGNGYDPSMSSYTETEYSKSKVRRGSRLTKVTGVWWKNVVGAKPPQRPPVGIPKRPIAAQDTTPSVKSGNSGGGSGSGAGRGTNRAASPGGGRLSRVGEASETDGDGFVTAPEFSSTEERFQTADEGEKTGTTSAKHSDSEYYTAQEDDEGESD